MAVTIKKSMGINPIPNISERARWIASNSDTLGNPAPAKPIVEMEITQRIISSSIQTKVEHSFAFRMEGVEFGTTPH